METLHSVDLILWTRVRTVLRRFSGARPDATGESEGAAG